MEINEKEIIVKVLHQGQLRPYAGSDNHYIIRCNKYFSEKNILEFCTAILYKCNVKSSDERQWYQEYYTFRKIEEDRYEYHVYQEYLD